MEYPFGWKVEYAKGQAILSPRDVIIRTKLTLTPRSLPPTYHLMAIDPTFKAPMIEAFYDAFQDSVEFCNWSAEAIWENAEKSIEDFFKGRRGEPLACSLMVVEPQTQTILGLVLFVEKEDRYSEERHIKLDLLLVRSGDRRKGIGTEMVTSAMNQLQKKGIEEIYSAYHICNTMSQNWHRKFGFQEIYDPFYLRLKYAWFRHEIWRHEKLGLDEKIEALIQEKDYWFSQLPEEWRY